MPLPLLIVGAAVAAAGWGAKKGLDAKSDFDDAEDINEEAQEHFDQARRSLEHRRKKTQNGLERLGRQKIRLYRDALEPFVRTYKQIKNVDYRRRGSIENENLRVGPDEILEIEEVTVHMAEAVGGTASAVGSGALAGVAAYGSVGVLGTASTGTAIAGLSGAAATNATLAWLGGGSLAAGGLGIAGGAAVLGGIVAAPVILVGGLMMASKAEAAREDALSNRSKAKGAALDMEAAECQARVIGRKAKEVRRVLKRLQEDHLDCDLADLQELVAANVDYRTYSHAEKELVGRTMALAKTAKNLSEARLLEENGSLAKAIRETLRGSKEFLRKLDEM